MLRTNGPQQGKSLSSRELEVVNKMLKICKVLLPEPNGRDFLLQSPSAAGETELTWCVRRCYVGGVLVEVRKQGVAGLRFRGASEARAKGAAGSSAEVAVGSPAD